MPHRKKKQTGGDIGLRRSEVGDTPGVLDPVGIDNPVLQGLLDVGTQFRFGMGAPEKFTRTVRGENIPGFEGPPASADIDQAQRSLSVAAGSERFGPLIPTIMSLLSVDNPSALNPESAAATRAALEAVQSGEFRDGPQNTIFNAILAGNPTIGALFQRNPANFDLANTLLEKFGKQTGGPVGSNIRIPTATLMMQQGGQIENDLLQSLVQRQQMAAALTGQTPPSQGQLPAGTGPQASPQLGAPQVEQAPISPEEATSFTFQDILEALGLVAQKKQTGGFVGNVIDQLGNVQANTGKLDKTASQLNAFNPFGGGGIGNTAQNTLDSLLGTGNPVDVGGITQAAQSQAGRTFRDLTGGINENFGALGLGSSSARTASLAQAAEDASTRVGEAGLQAGVASQENAANRQLGAFSPFFAGTGQRLGAQQAAGNLFGQAAGLDLQAQTAPLGPATNLAANLTGNLQGSLGRRTTMNQGPGPPVPRPDSERSLGRVSRGDE